MLEKAYRNHLALDSICECYFVELWFNGKKMARYDVVLVPVKFCTPSFLSSLVGPGSGYLFACCEQKYGSHKFFSK